MEQADNTCKVNGIYCEYHLSHACHLHMLFFFFWHTLPCHRKTAPLKFPTPHGKRACTWRVCHLLWPFGHLWSRAARDAHHHRPGHPGHCMPASSGLRQSHNQHLWHPSQGEKPLRHRYLCLKVRKYEEGSSFLLLGAWTPWCTDLGQDPALVWSSEFYTVITGLFTCTQTPPVRSGWEDGILSC